MKKIGLLVLLIVQLFMLKSCDSKEIYKTTELRYYNMANDTITQIKLELQLKESEVTRDSIIINKMILPGDSLYFSYNNENSLLTTNMGHYYTTVSFKNIPQIKNNVVYFSYAGFFDAVSEFAGLVYIGNTNILHCSIYKEGTPQSTRSNSSSPCDLNLVE